VANILVVDDDEIVLKTVHASLVKAGHTVFTAKHGHGALEISAKEKLHLIVTDINMPGGINGFNLVKMLREAANAMDLPIVMMSSRRSEFDVKKGIEVGVDDYIIKPVDFDIFIAKVSSLLQKGGHSFSLSPVDNKGFIDLRLAIQIVGLSEEGLQVISMVDVEVNRKTTFDSPIFEEIGISPPMMRVAHCERLETEERSFAIKFNFIGLTAGDLQKVRVYASRSRLRKSS
jgi:DNA-binding response OmpR family regulator